jgi:hypothetical protein
MTPGTTFHLAFEQFIDDAKGRIRSRRVVTI